MEKLEYGVLQLLWDAWTPSQERIVKSSDQDFVIAVIKQLLEIKQHLNNVCLEPGSYEKAMNEIVDIISLSQNWLRKFGLNPDSITALIKDRVESRYVGKTEEILDKYEWKQ